MKYLSLIGLLIITACGFSPVYGTKSPERALSNIEIGIIPNREGQIVRNHLIDHIHRKGYASNPRYQLNVSAIEETIVEIGIDKDDEASRAQLRLKTTMRLIDLNNNKAVLVRDIRSTTGYNILAGQFTTFITEQDAREQGLRALSNNIITQLEIYFNR